MSYSSILKGVINFNTISIFEKNAHVAMYQNISRTDSFKFLTQTEFDKFLLART